MARAISSSRASSERRLVVVVVERALVAAGLRALHDERVDARRGRLLGLGARGDRAPDAAAGGAERLDDVALGAAERERDDRGPLAGGELELRRPVVVRPARLAGLHAVALRLALHPRGVGVDRRLVDLLARGVKEIEAERA